MDMLVRLYDLQDIGPTLVDMKRQAVAVRRPMAHERRQVLDWVARQFGNAAAGWPGECEVAFSRQPITCRIAVQDGDLIGFVCYEVTARGLVGPIGIQPNRRSRGIGRALLLQALHDMAQLGYVYAVIGQVGPTEFFSRSVGAQEIPGSTPGPFPSQSALK